MSTEPDATGMLEQLSGGDDRAARQLLTLVTAEETARMLDISQRSVERDWKMGQAWLRRELSPGATDS